MKMELVVKNNSATFASQFLEQMKKKKLDEQTMHCKTEDSEKGVSFRKRQAFSSQGDDVLNQKRHHDESHSGSCQQHNQSSCLASVRSNNEISRLGFRPRRMGLGAQPKNGFQQNNTMDTLAKLINKQLRKGRKTEVLSEEEDGSSQRAYMPSSVLLFIAIQLKRSST